MAKSANIYVAWISMNLETNDFFYQKTCIHKDLEKTSYSAGKTGSKRPDKYLVVRNNTCNLSQCFFFRK